jgi:hypothetical protein
VETSLEFAMGSGIFFEISQKFVGRQIVFENKWSEIAPFFVVAKMITYDDPRDAARVQLVDESASDKTRGTCDENAALRAQETFRSSSLRCMLTIASAS